MGEVDPALRIGKDFEHLLEVSGVYRLLLLDTIEELFFPRRWPAVPEESDVFHVGVMQLVERCASIVAERNEEPGGDTVPRRRLKERVLVRWWKHDLVRKINPTTPKEPCKVVLRDHVEVWAESVEIAVEQPFNADVNVWMSSSHKSCGGEAAPRILFRIRVHHDRVVFKTEESTAILGIEGCGEPAGLAGFAFLCEQGEVFLGRLHRIA